MILSSFLVVCFPSVFISEHLYFIIFFSYVKVLKSFFAFVRARLVERQCWDV